MREVKLLKSEWLIPLNVGGAGELISHRFRDVDSVSGERTSCCGFLSEHLANLVAESEPLRDQVAGAARRCERCESHVRGLETLRKIRAAYDTREA